jgi:proteasome lid subunit RPN8/RPN11
VTDAVHVTAGLLKALLKQAADAEPDSVSIALGATEGAAFADADVPPETEVLTHLYIPDAGASNRAVFGVDLAVSPGRTAGRFLSHPDGDPALSSRDDLHASVLLAIPPWTPADCTAYDRAGRQRPLTVVDAEPPEESLP